jgi:hypothetical protein
MKYPVDPPFAPECNWIATIYDCEPSIIHVVFNWVALVMNFMIALFGTWLLWKRRRRLFDGALYRWWQQSWFGRKNTSQKKNTSHRRQADIRNEEEEITIETLDDDAQSAISNNDLTNGIDHSEPSNRCFSARGNKEPYDPYRDRALSIHYPVQPLRRANPQPARSPDLLSRGTRFTGRPVDILMLMFTLCMYIRATYNILTLLDALPNFAARHVFLDLTFATALWGEIGYVHGIINCIPPTLIRDTHFWHGMCRLWSCVGGWFRQRFSGILRCCTTERKTSRNGSIIRQFHENDRNVRPLGSRASLLDQNNRYGNDVPDVIINHDNSSNHWC